MVKTSAFGPTDQDRAAIVAIGRYIGQRGGIGGDAVPSGECIDGAAAGILDRGVESDVVPGQQAQPVALE